MALQASGRCGRPRTRTRQPWLLLLQSIAAFLAALAALDEAAVLLRHANALGRRCAVERDPSPPTGRRPRMAVVTFSDDGSGGGRRRSFSGVREAVWGNKRAYAERMGYDFVDAGGLVDPSRPPSWSKIPAIRSQLQYYDWVFWNDADTLVMNPDVSLENILLAVIGHRDVDVAPDLVVTEDFNGINSGVFFIRSSEWSRRFLDTWWNQTSFVQFGSTKTGDNAAMKYLINNLHPEELHAHVSISPLQCLFNSYPWFPTLKSVCRLIFFPRTTWKGAYSDGDFMVHLAGLDDKKTWIAKMLQEKSVQIGSSKPHTAKR